MPNSPDRIHPMDPSWISKGNIPSLHGLRAFSVLIVVIAHGMSKAHLPKDWLPIDGRTGVDIFFVISGFLITLLLIREHDNTGRISLRQFYLRRALRIFPAYYTFLAVMGLLTLTCGLPISLIDFGVAATYCTSLVPRSLWPSWDIMHSWSLSVEEHFYLVWPLTLAIVGRRTAFLIAVSYIAAAPALRYFLTSQPQCVVWAFTPARADAIAWGCCLAIAVASPKWRSRLTLTAWQCNLIILLSAVGLCANTRCWSFPLPQQYLVFYTNSLIGTVDSLFITALVWACVSHSSGIVGRLLNSRPATFIGTLSYSLYLWQEPFTVGMRDDDSPLVQMPYNLLYIFAAALCSYVLIERPFLSFKGRLTGAEPASNASTTIDTSAAETLPFVPRHFQRHNAADGEDSSIKKAA